MNLPEQMNAHRRFIGLFIRRTAAQNERRIIEKSAL